MGLFKEHLCLGAIPIVPDPEHLGLALPGSFLAFLDGEDHLHPKYHIAGLQSKKQDQQDPREAAHRSRLRLLLDVFCHDFVSF